MARAKKLSLEDKLFTVRRREYGESHIKVDCRLCEDCLSRICTRVCPAEVYVWDEEKQTVHIRYENCLECGACRVACEMDAIQWMNPVDGAGIEYRQS